MLLVFNGELAVALYIAVAQPQEAVAKEHDKSR